MKPAAGAGGHAPDQGTIMQDLLASLPAAQRLLEQAEDALFQKQPRQALDNFALVEQQLFEALFGADAGAGEPEESLLSGYIYTLRKIGDICSEAGELQRGIAWYNETISKNENAPAANPKVFIYLHAKLGELHLLNGQLPEAKYSLARARDWAEKCSHQSTSVEMLEALLDLRDNNIKRGLATLLKLYTQATGTGYLTLYFRNRVLTCLAGVENLTVVKKARELAESDFATIFAMAEDAREKDELRLALRLYLLCLDKVQFLPEGTMPVEKVFATYAHVGRMISGLGFHRVAGEYFTECLRLHDLSSVSSHLQVLCYYWYGRALANMKDYGFAFKTFENGLRLARRHKDPLLIFQLQYEIAIALAKSDKPGEAQVLLVQLANDLKQLPEGRDKDLAFAAYNNQLAFARGREYAWDKALLLYRESLARIQGHGCTGEYVRTIRGLGLALLHAADGDPAAAEKHLLESVQVFTLLQETDERVESLKACAELYLRRGEIDAAMHRMAVERNLAARQQSFNQAQKLLSDNLPVIYFAAPRLYVAVSTRVAGAATAPSRPPILWNADSIGVARQGSR